jgi:excisionase family DNA binding protein
MEDAAPRKPHDVVGYPRMASILECSERTIRERVHSGEIPAIRIGRLVRFDVDAVLTALSQPKESA